MLPLMLDLRGVRVLVVGSGPVGRRKLAAAAAAGAAVRVVSLEAASDDHLEWLCEPYAARHVADCRLAFAAGPPEVNARVVADAKAAGLWVNSASDPHAGDVLLPAVYRQGDFTVAVSTGGGSPGFARKVRDRLAPQFDNSLGLFVQLLDDMRREVLTTIPDEAARRTLLEHFADWPWLERLRAEGIDHVRTAMRQIVRTHQP